MDFLEQTVDYRTPVELFDEIARFDGSCYPDRTTRGEVTVICDKEEANFLFANLFHGIVTGKRTVDEAKYFAAETEANHTFKNMSSPYLEEILFPTQRYTNDPGISLTIWREMSNKLKHSQTSMVYMMTIWQK